MSVRDEINPYAIGKTAKSLGGLYTFHLDSINQFGLNRKSDIALQLAYRDNLIQKLKKELDKVEQVLGKSLGYPCFKNDQKNFPGSTEADGVCIGDHTAVTLAMEVSDFIKGVNEDE